VHPAALQERTGQAVALVATSGAQTRAKPVRRGKSLSLEGTAGDDIAAIDYRKNHAFFTLNGVTIQYKAPGLRTIAIDLGDGNDVLVAGDGAPALSVSGGAGNDTIVGGPHNDTLRGDEGDDSIVGNAGGDSINGGDGSDTLFGNAGQDTLSSQDGGQLDYVDGGADFNTGIIDLMDSFNFIQDRQYLTPSVDL